jgi:protein O-GlcNAc transferase
MLAFRSRLGIAYHEEAVYLLKTRLSATVLLAVLPSVLHPCLAQEPSASLKEADADYRAGVAALSRNDLNAALADFEKVVRLAPSAEQGHSALGAVLFRAGRTSEAIRELEKALAIKPSDASAQTNLALAYEQSAQPANALPWFSKLQVAAAAEKHQLPSYVLVAYARALAQTQQIPAAIARMKEAIAAEPQSAELHDDLGSLYAQHKDWLNAKEAFAAALRINPNLAVAHLHLGLTLLTQQQPGGLEELAKAYQLAPDNPEIAFEFGSELAGAGQDEQAIPILRHALDLDPSSTAATYQLGLALQRTSAPQDAIPLLQKAAAADPKNPDVLTNLGMALCQVQQAKDAVPILQRAASLAPENVTAHQNLAAAYIQLNQFDDAIAQLRAALKLAPDAARLHYDLGLALKMKDDAADAIPELETAEKLDPSGYEAPYVLGVLYLQDGRYADAARELNLSLKLHPENGDGWATLGSVDNHLDNLPEAETALKEAIRQLPQQPDPHLTLAAVLVKENRPAEATAERKIAADLMRENMNHQRAEIATNTGNSLLKNGKVDDAMAAFHEAITYDPNNAAAHAGLAKALQQQGKTMEAAAERQKAASLQRTPQ